MDVEKQIFCKSRASSYFLTFPNREQEKTPGFWTLVQISRSDSEAPRTRKSALTLA
jgi:hypothetical protein